MSSKSADVTVACVYSRSGQRDTNVVVGHEPNRARLAGFDDYYVYRLWNSILHHAGDVRFVCLTNEPLLGIETIRLQRCRGGWFDKLELFSHRYPGPVLYLDLDTMVVSDIRDIVARLREFRFAAIRERCSVPMLNSSVMAFDGTQDWSHLSECTDLDENDQPVIYRGLRGDIQWLEDSFPGRVTFYSDRARRNPDESIVVFQRHPRPAQVGWDHRLPDRQEQRP